MGNAASYPWEADAEDQCSLISQHMQLMVLQSGGWHMQAKSHRGQQEKQPSQFGLLGQQVSIQRVIEGTLQSHDWAQLTHMSHTPNAPTNCQPKHVGQHPRARRHWCISRRMRSTTRYKETARNTAAGRGMRRSDRGAVLADTVGKVRAAINSKMCPCSIIPQYNTRAAHFLQIFLSRIAGLWKASFRSHGDGLDAAWMVAPKEQTCPVCPARTLGKREGASLSHVSRKVRLLVSSIQAVLASTAGYIVASSCKDVIHDQHWLAATYTRFAVPYFIYDIYAMYLCYEHKHKLKGHSGGWSLTRAYLYKEFLMILHHVFMVAVCFPVSVLWRDGKGDFFLGCMLMAEVSTPFVCFGKILIQYKKQHTLLHRVNGVLMLVTFFCCRLLLFPYMYWVYGQRVGLPLYRVPFNLSPEYNLGAAILMAPQVYWFYLICRRAYTLFRQSVLSQRPKNGHPAPVSTSAKEQDCSQ